MALLGIQFDTQKRLRSTLSRISIYDIDVVCATAYATAYELTASDALPYM